MSGEYIHVRAPALALYARLWIATEGLRAAEAYMPVVSEMAAVGLALNRLDCFAFQTCTRQEVTIDGTPFMTEFSFPKWRAFIGQEFLTGEIAIMGRPESAQLSHDLRQRKIKAACMTRLGSWQGLSPDDRIYDAISGERILRRAGSNTDSLGGVISVN